MLKLVNHPRAGALTGVLGGIALASGLAVWLTLAPAPAPSPAPLAASSPEVRQLLASAGVNARTLTAAGLSAQEVSQVVTTARSELTRRGEALRTKRAAFSRAAAELHHLESAVIRGESTDIAGLAAARNRANAAALAWKAERADILTATFADLSDQQRAMLRSLRSGLSAEVPMELAAREWTEREAVEIRRHSAAMRIAAAQGTSPPAEAAAAYAAAAADPAVAAAASVLLQHRAANQAAWRAALSSPQH